MTNRNLIPLITLLAVTAFAHGYVALAQSEPRDPQVTVSASQPWIAAGQPVTISWGAIDRVCTSPQFDTGGRDSGSVVMYPTRDTYYGVVCGNDEAGVSVKVTPEGPPPPLTVSFVANPSTVVRGNLASLSWSSNGDTCNGYATFDTGGASSGTASVNPSSVDGGIATYVLRCTRQIDNAGVNAEVQVRWREPDFEASCRPAKTTARVGEPVQWNATAWNGVAPFAYEWAGQFLNGLTGSTVTATYNSPGEKEGSVTATDSSRLGAGLRVVSQAGRRCSGPALTGNITAGMAEDGGWQNDMERQAAYLAESIFYMADGGWVYDPAYTDLYKKMASNPENYCVDVTLKQRCNPGAAAGWIGCDFSFKTYIHQGSANRDQNASDYGDTIPNNGPGPAQWDQTRQHVIAVGNINAGVPQTVNRSCSVPVTVSPEEGPTVTLTANPVSILAGETSTVTWTSQNTTSCVATNFSTGPTGAISGSVPVQPPIDTTYSVTCTGPGGTATDTATVKVTSPLQGRCAVSAESIETGKPVTYTATATGGAGLYSYTWSGADNLTGSSASVTKTYTSTGTKTASVTISSGGRTVTAPCTEVTVTEAPPPPPPPLAGSCSVNPTAIDAGQSATWTATVTEGTGPFTYAWNGTDGLSGTGASVTKQYDVEGTKTASVTITAGAGNSVNVACNNNLAVGVPPQPDLTASAVTGPDTAAVGATLVLSASATNNGGAATSGGFPMLFQIKSPESLKNSGYIGPLASQASQSAAINFTVTAKGTYTVRACANFNTEWVAIVSESNYSNNCGPEKTIVVGDPPPREPPGNPTYSCSADGKQATLSWSPSSGSSYYWVRVFDPAPCPSGWMKPGSNSQICVPNPDQVYGTSITYPTDPNKTLSWSVAGTNGVYPSGTTANADGSFRCSPQTGKLECTVSNQNPKVGDTVTYRAIPDGVSGPYEWEDQEPGGSYGSAITATRLITDNFEKIMFVNAGNVRGTCPNVTASCTNPQAEITASPLRVRADEDRVTVRWSASGINGSCKVTANGVTIEEKMAAACTLPSGVYESTLKTQTVFKITCSDGAEDQVVVNVIPKFIEF